MNAAETTAKYSPIHTGAETEDSTLPRDIFTNRFHYDLVVRKHLYCYLLSLFVAMCTFAIWVSTLNVSSDNLIGIMVFFVLISLMLLVIGTAVLWAKKGTHAATNDVRNALSLLGEVVKVQPGIDEKKWDLIAARLNKIFYNNDNSTTPYFFYDGSEVASFFKSNYVQPSLLRNGPNTANANVPENANTSETHSAESKPNTAAASNLAISEIQSIIDRAVKIYTDNLEECWQEYVEIPSQAAETV